MRAGFGKTLLTPPLGVELAGYGYYLQRQAKYVLDPLYARAVLLEDGARRALMISCDLLGLSAEVCAQVIGHAGTLGVPADAVMLVSVHTHTGPCVKYHEGCGVPDAVYVATVAARICRAVDAAAGDVREVTGIRRAAAPAQGDYLYNRASPDGPVDRMVRGIWLDRGEGTPIAMVSAACHGVFRGRIPGISADFSGAVCRQMERRGCHSLYLNGLCGDIDPWKPTEARMEAFAAEIARAFLSSLRPCPATLWAARIPFVLRLTPATREDIADMAGQAARRAGGEETPAGRVALAWKQKMLESFPNLRTQESIAAQAVVLGGVPVIAFPFEGFTKTGEQIRQILCRPDALTLGCAEELLGYLPTRDDIRRGAYAARESAFLYGRLPAAPGEAERLGEEMGRALARCLKGV